MVKRGKNYQEATKLLDKTKDYTPQQAIELAKKMANSRFDETVELHLRMGVDPRDASQQVRGVALLPHGLGKQTRVLVFAQGEAEKIQLCTFPNLKDMMDQTMAAGIPFYVCDASKRMFDWEDVKLIEGAKIVGAATLNDLVLEYDSVMWF